MKIKLFIVGVALVLASAGTAQAQFPAGFGFAMARRYIGPQIRYASPQAYSGLLAAQRSIPPQVRNNWNNSFNPYRGGGSPWNAELNYWRSIPPEVRNKMDREQRQMGYAPQPQVIYVPVPVPAPSAPMPTGARPNTVIPAPPPPTELPNIIRQ